MKQVHAFLMIAVFLLVILVPLTAPLGTVSAQSSYSITNIDHVVEVMSSGQVVISDTIQVTGQVTDGFLIGLPSKYSGDILQVVAYDDNYSYPVNPGVQLGDQPGFYAVSVDFNGHTPSVFTVSFLLTSSPLNFESSINYFVLDYPAFPSLTQSVANCNATIILPSNPGTFNITETNGNFVNGNNYDQQNLAAYTNIDGFAFFDVSQNTLDIVNISQLNRSLNIDSSGEVHVSDLYYIMNNASIPITSFVLDVPTSATSIEITDAFGRQLSTQLAGTISYGSSDPSHDADLINATFVTFLQEGDSTTLAAQYILPSAILQGSDYVLKDFRLYPDFFYYVQHATITFNPPEGATIVSPQISALDSICNLDKEFLPRHPNIYQKRNKLRGLRCS